MKRIILLLSVAFVLLGCEQPKGVYEKEVIFLLDQTDTGLVTFSFDQIRPLLTMTNSDNGIKFRVKSIEDNDFGNHLNVFLRPSSGGDETQEERYLLKSAFYKQAKRAYDSLSHYRGVRPHSVIYRVIVDELKRLSKSPGQHVLVIQSDLKESSDIINLYKKKDLQLLIENPEAVKRRFTENSAIPDLKDITVIFVFKPKNLNENQIYTAILSCYKELIEESGGFVKTSL